MKKLLFAIFAHPDDEAFGPSGTLYMEAQHGTELHLITLTAGQAGTNHDNVADLGAVRLREWRAAGQLIGAQHLHHLGYIDGRLSNQDHIAITDTIMQIVTNAIDGRNAIEIEFMSMDLNGVTGHIDHIVAGRSACLAMYRLRERGVPITRIRLACRPADRYTGINTDFVLMEPGRTPNEITETIDARQHIEQVYAIMRAHHTQRNDGESHIAALGDSVAINHFIVLK
ncbi:MAG: PIG-L deacetylase family protein [Candidatus Saccharimonadales bacterium]